MNEKMKKGMLAALTAMMLVSSSMPYVAAAKDAGSSTAVSQPAGDSGKNNSTESTSKTDSSGTNTGNSSEGANGASSGNSSSESNSSSSTASQTDKVAKPDGEFKFNLTIKSDGKDDKIINIILTGDKFTHASDTAITASLTADEAVSKKILAAVKAAGWTEEYTLPANLSFLLNYADGKWTPADQSITLTAVKPEEPGIPAISAAQEFKFRVRVACQAAGTGHQEKVISFSLKGSQFTVNEADKTASAAVSAELLNSIIAKTKWGLDHQVTAGIDSVSLQLKDGVWVAVGTDNIQVKTTCEPGMEGVYSLKANAKCLAEGHKDKTKIPVEINISLFKKQLKDGIWTATYTAAAGSELAGAVKDGAGWNEKIPHNLTKDVVIDMTYQAKKGVWTFDNTPEFVYDCVKDMKEEYTFNMTLKCADKGHQDILLKETIPSSEFTKQYKDGKWSATFVITDLPAALGLNETAQKKWGGQPHTLTEPATFTLNYDAANKKWVPADAVVKFISVPDIKGDKNFNFTNITLNCVGNGEEHKQQTVKSIKVEGKNFTKEYKDGKWIATYEINEKNVPSNVLEKVTNKWEDHRLLTPTNLTMTYVNGEWVPQTKTSLDFTCAPKMDAESYAFNITLKCNDKKEGKADHAKHSASTIRLELENGLFVPKLDDEDWSATYTIDKDSPAVAQLLANAGWGTTPNHKLKESISFNLAYDGATKKWNIENPDVAVQFVNAPNNGGTQVPGGPGGTTPNPSPSNPGGNPSNPSGPSGTTPGAPGTVTPGGTAPGSTAPGTVTIKNTSTNRTNTKNPTTGDNGGGLLAALITLLTAGSGGGIAFFLKKRRGK